MTPTSTQIATEAAEAIHALIEREADNQMYPHKSDLASLILSAAAKMVQQSGAVEALEWAERIAPPQSGLRVSSHAALEKLRSISEGEAGE